MRECPPSGTETLLYNIKHLITIGRYFQDFVRIVFDFSHIKFQKSTKIENKIGTV